MSKKLFEDSLFVKIAEVSLHLKRIYTNEEGIPLVLIHGSMEDGRIFYSKSMKGLAPFLAKHGYDVYVADLQGRGQSLPKVSRSAQNDQFDAINKELRAIYQFIDQRKPNSPQHWIAHSWGGVLILAYLARHSKQNIASCTFFGTKRRISLFNIEKFWKVDFFWSFVGELSTWVWGYFPSKKLKFGSDNESTPLYRQTRKWVYSKDWIDPVDGFDYHEGLKKADLPPTLYLAGKNDRILGNKIDVGLLMAEAPHPENRFIYLSKANGHLKDYDHVNILTAPSAEEDHFPEVVKWLKLHS